MSRPEHLAPPEIFYSESEAKKYTSNSRIQEIQTSMSERAIELLALDPKDGPKLILDLGCGSGLSGEVLESYGHQWIGVDISQSMLDIALDREVDGDLVLGDMGQGLGFRPGCFDAAISISAIQWLCNADKASHNPKRRLTKFFSSLYQCLVRGARSVFQFYPENPAQMELITSVAMKCGFSGGLVVDYPNSTKAKKYFLCLFAGVPPGGYKLPEGLSGEGEEENETSTFTSERKTKKRKRTNVKDRDWILRKKESQRRKGMEVRPDTKYTGRKRPWKGT